MTLDEWHQVLATEPATPGQLGALHGEFRRLGFDPVADRAERLAVCAAMLGLEGLGSARDLVMGQAGQLVDALRQVPDRAGLPAAKVGEDLAVKHDPGARAATVVPADVLRAVVAALAAWPEVLRMPRKAV